MAGVMDGASEMRVPHATELLDFVAAALSFDPVRIAATRDAVLNTMGEPAMADAAAVIAGFNGITRIADATGIPLEDFKAEQSENWRATLGINQFANTKS
jgi:DNA-binding phage protein